MLDGTPQEVQKAYLKFMSNERKRALDEKLEEENKKEEQQKEEAESETKAEETKKEPENEKQEPVEERRGTGEARITKVKCYDESGKESYFINGDGTLKFKYSIMSTKL